MFQFFRHHFSLVNGRICQSKNSLTLNWIELICWRWWSIDTCCFSFISCWRFSIECSEFTSMDCSNNSWDYIFLISLSTMGNIENWFSYFLAFALFFFYSKWKLSLGRTFGPLMFIWFSSLFAIGLYRIRLKPVILKSFNPFEAIQYLIREKKKSFYHIGSIPNRFDSIRFIFVHLRWSFSFGNRMWSFVCWSR